MLKVAITGGNGLVGSRIVELLNQDFQFLPLSSRDMNITDKFAVENTLKDLDFDLFLHLAGYTKVDNAETEKDLAYQINVEGTRNIFDAVEQKNKKLIYISTDFVFDGSAPPYDEDSPTHPLGYYGVTKYKGEQVVKDKAMIARISYPYRTQFEPKKDFVRKLVDLMKQGTPLTMMTDALITPTFIDDIAFALKHLMNNYSPEIYHLVGSQCLSPFEAGKMIAQKFKLDESLVQKISFADYSKGKAVRPQFSQVKTKKNDFYRMKNFEEGLEEMIKVLYH